MTEAILKPELHAKVDAKLDAFVERFYKEVPFGRHQLDAKELHMEYYKRHSMETIRRIRLKRTVDALVVHYFTKCDPRRAKAWAQYLDEEMLHDEFFAADLLKLGVTKETIYGNEPLVATKLLQGYFYYGMEHENSPMAPLASAYFLEYTTRKTQPMWLDNLEKVLGKEGIKGARAHVSYDIAEDHTGAVWNVMMAVVKTPEDEERLVRHFDNLYGLFCAYFTELYEVTIGAAPKMPAGAAAEAVRQRGPAAATNPS